MGQTHINRNTYLKMIQNRRNRRANRQALHVTDGLDKESVEKMEIIEVDLNSKDGDERMSWL